MKWFSKKEKAVPAARPKAFELPFEAVSCSDSWDDYVTWGDDRSTDYSYMFEGQVLHSLTICLDHQYDEPLEEVPTDCCCTGTFAHPLVRLMRAASEAQWSLQRATYTVPSMYLEQWHGLVARSRALFTIAVEAKRLNLHGADIKAEYATLAEAWLTFAGALEDLAETFTNAELEPQEQSVLNDLETYRALVADETLTLMFRELHSTYVQSYSELAKN